MLIVSAFVALATVAAPVVREARPARVNPLFAASVAINAADFLTRPPTEHEQFVRRFGDGGMGRAATALYENPAAFAVVKAGLGVVLPELGARYLEKRGKRTAATVLRAAAVAAPAYGTFANVRGKVRRGDWNVSLRLSF